MRFKYGMAMFALMAISTTGFAESGPATYAKDVAPILNANCASCHHPGEIGPMSLMSYKEVRPWAKSIRKVVHERSMPPWDADSSKVEYSNDSSLSEKEVATVLAWVDSGAPMGDPADLPEIPVFNDTWAMGEPDMIFTADAEFVVPAEDQFIEYQSVYFAPAVEEDLYITAWEIRPSERSVVHHANLVRAPKRLDSVGIGQAVLTGGDYIGSYLPGARPLSYPEGAALLIPAGSVIQIQIHYAGGPEPLTDRTRFGVKLAQGRIDKVMRSAGTDDWEIEIEPNGTFDLETEVTLNHDLTLLSSGAHMHLRGSAYVMSAILPDGTKKLITDVPNYDFNWQSNYQLANPISVPKGTKLHVAAHWDNTENNPNVPDPNMKVVYGEWTDNEMLTTWSHVVLTKEKLGLKVVDGHVVGKFDDAQDSISSGILQSLPNTFTRPRKSDESKEVSSAGAN